VTVASYFTEKRLLSPPTERAAFSDRQAYVCAELSKLAYFRFEGGHGLEQALEIVREIVTDEEKFAALREQLAPILGGAPGTPAEGEAALARILEEPGFVLVRTFSVAGTQAFFCTRKIPLDTGSEKTVAYLVFRGTEPKDFQDLRTDAKAALREHQIEGEKEKLTFHGGYLEAFLLVHDEVKKTLDETEYDQLFITGHSLGGALAMVATRILAAQITGACYTFGAPPIGTMDIQNKLKTPVYEIINEIDIVPRLPDPWITGALLLLIKAARWATRVASFFFQPLFSGTWDERFEAFLESMSRYRHPGYLSYLVGTTNSARLRYNVSGVDKLRWWTLMMMKGGFGRFKKMLDDHSIDLYVAKLKSHALSRR
jgi:pimeloyl-ACP methyl ester carboxylesterase